MVAPPPYVPRASPCLQHSHTPPLSSQGFPPKGTPRDANPMNPKAAHSIVVREGWGAVGVPIWERNTWCKECSSGPMAHTTTHILACKQRHHQSASGALTEDAGLPH